MKLTPSMVAQARGRALGKKLLKLQARIQSGELSINDVRVALGLRPFPVPECDERSNTPLQVSDNDM